MQSINPIEINGEVYPLYSVSLAITSLYENSQFEARVAARLVPTRIDAEGNSITSEENAKSVIIGTLSEVSGPEQQAMSEIYQAVQKFIIVKGY